MSTCVGVGKGKQVVEQESECHRNRANHRPHMCGVQVMEQQRIFWVIGVSRERRIFVNLGA